MKSTKVSRTTDPTDPYIWAFYQDNRATYGLVQPGGAGPKVWRVRFQTPSNDPWADPVTIDFCHTKFKDIGSFIGYCKLKYHDSCTG
jgi:hypothetical protein